MIHPISLVHFKFDFTCQVFQSRQISQPVTPAPNSQAILHTQTAVIYSIQKRILRVQESISPPLPPPVDQSVAGQPVSNPEKHMSVPTRDSPRLSARGRRIRKDDGRWTAQVAGRKNRTIFTEEQHSALLAAYEADKYPTTIQKELLARQLGL